MKMFLRKFLVFPSWLDVVLVVLLGIFFRASEWIVLVVAAVGLLCYLFSIFLIRQVFLLRLDGLKYKFVLICASLGCFFVRKRVSLREWSVFIWL